MVKGAVRLNSRGLSSVTDPKAPSHLGTEAAGALIWMICRVSVGHLNRGLENSPTKVNTIPVLMGENEAQLR